MPVLLNSAVCTWIWILKAGEIFCVYWLPTTVWIQLTYDKWLIIGLK